MDPPGAHRQCRVDHPGLLDAQLVLLPNVILQRTTPTLVPTGGSLDNYAACSTTPASSRRLSVSLAVTLLTVVAAIAIAFLGALAVSRFRWRGRKSFILALLLIQMLPAEGLFIAQYKMMARSACSTRSSGSPSSTRLRSCRSRSGCCAGSSPACRSTSRRRPWSTGCHARRPSCESPSPSWPPASWPPAVYAFLQAWNEFTVALVVMTEEQARTLPLWLRGFLQASAMRETDWGQVMAASTLVAIPVIAFFLMVQSRLSSGLVGGAVKG